MRILKLTERFFREAIRNNMSCSSNQYINGRRNREVKYIGIKDCCTFLRIFHIEKLFLDNPFLSCDQEYMYKLPEVVTG